MINSLPSSLDAEDKNNDIFTMWRVVTDIRENEEWNFHM